MIKFKTLFDCIKIRYIDSQRYCFLQYKAFIALNF